jgi:hypothetical protein
MKNLKLITGLLVLHSLWCSEENSWDLTASFAPSKISALTTTQDNIGNVIFC